MNFWRRLQRKFRSQWNTGVASEFENPEELLLRAQSEMRRRHAQNRERAVRAITQKNLLEVTIHDHERCIMDLSLRIREARDHGDEHIASRLLSNKSAVENSLDVLRNQWNAANVASHRVKIDLRRDEDRLQQKMAEALALRTQWKLLQIEQALTISLAQLSADGPAWSTMAHIEQRHRRNRERVVEAMTHRNYLQRLASDTRAVAERLRVAITAANRSGDEDKERDLLRDLEQYEATLATTEAALHQATLITGRAQSLIEAESVRYRALGKHMPFLGTVDKYSRNGIAPGNWKRMLLLMLVVCGLLLCAYWLS